MPRRIVTLPLIETGEEKVIPIPGDAQGRTQKITEFKYAPDYLGVANEDIEWAAIRSNYRDCGKVEVVADVDVLNTLTERSQRHFQEAWKNPNTGPQDGWA